MGLKPLTALAGRARQAGARIAAASRWYRPAAYGTAGVAIVVWALFGMAPLAHWMRLVVGVVIAALAVGSDVLYRRLKPLLGRVTAFAAVCLAWAALWVGLALASPTCLGPEGSGRCTPQATATFALLGLLFPLVVPAFTLMPWAAFRAGRSIWRRARP